MSIHAQYICRVYDTFYICVQCSTMCICMTNCIHVYVICNLYIIPQCSVRMYACICDSKYVQYVAYVACHTAQDTKATDCQLNRLTFMVDQASLSLLPKQPRPPSAHLNAVQWLYVEAAVTVPIPYYTSCCFCTCTLPAVVPVHEL
jgi:hypothetical protein